MIKLELVMWSQQMMNVVFPTIIISLFILLGDCRKLKARTSCEDCCSNRIVGGEKTDIRKVPYQASLMYEGRNFCGGSVVTEKHIITAAHCVVFFFQTLSNEAKLFVRIGSNYTSKGGVVSGIKHLICHPEFDFDNYDFDICILELQKNLKFSDTIRPVKIAELEPKGDEMGVVAGWGTLSENGKSPDDLRSVSVSVTNKTFCEEAYQKINPITERMICAGMEGKDSCQGDSGGGLVVEGVLVGISSTGFGCGVDSYPGVYTSVAHPSIRQFIKQVIHI